jgi:hypothetical protein
MRLVGLQMRRQKCMKDVAESGCMAEGMPCAEAAARGPTDGDMEKGSLVLVVFRGEPTAYVGATGF